MRMNTFTLVPVAVITVFLGLGILAAQAPAVAQEAASSAQNDPMKFANGAKTWADVCARCHNMRDPKSLRDDQWRAAVAHMRVRAGLTGEEAENVLAFLQQSN